MIERQTIIDLAQEALRDSGLFLVEADVLPGARIFVYIDSEEGVGIDDCIRVSRFIESSLDRESHDFELNVSSAGMDRPLTHPRQFTKAIGKAVILKLKDGRKLEGLYRGTEGDAYILETEPKKNKKAPSDPLLTVAMAEVAEVRRAVRFK